MTGLLYGGGFGQLGAQVITAGVAAYPDSLHP